MSSNSTLSNHAHGFTLIELLCVITILGVLAAVAVPKFIDLGADAKQSKMQSVAGAMRSMAGMVFSQCAVDATCDIQAGAAPGNGLGNSLVIQGGNITLAYGYPRHTSAGIVRSVNLTNVSDGGNFYITDYTSGGRDGIRIRPATGVSVNTCEVRYSQPQAAGQSPLIEETYTSC